MSGSGLTSPNDMNRNSDRAEPPTNFILPQIPRNEFPLERSSAQIKNQSFSVDQQVLFDAYSQLSLELGALLNRVDVSDCYLNVKGFYRFTLYRKIFSFAFQELSWLFTNVYSLHDQPSFRPPFHRMADRLISNSGLGWKRWFTKKN